MKPLTPRQAELGKHLQTIIDQEEGDYESYMVLGRRLKERETLEAGEIGPILGAMAGYAHNRRRRSLNNVRASLRWRLIELAVRLMAFLVWRHRPGYNDFLMVFWQCCKYETFLVRRMLARQKHPDPAVSASAKWMIDSVQLQDPRFDRMVCEEKWPLHPGDRP